MSPSQGIVINLSRLGRKGTGLAIYSRTVVDCLKSSFRNLAVVGVSDADYGEDVRKISAPHWVTMTSSVSRIRPILWLIYSILLFPRKEGKIIGTTHHVIPGARHQLVTVHDLRPYFFPDSMLQKLYFRYVLPPLLRRIDGVMTVSETTKELIVAYYGLPSSRVYVVPNCVDTSRFRQGEQGGKEVEPYLLMVGATWRHKNAHEVLAMSHLWSGRYRLKILAGEGKYIDSVKAAVKQSAMQSHVDFVGYLSEPELISLYQCASALVYPSLMEGFGIPPLEAAACGVPVIVSDIPVFREIYGDFPIYVRLSVEQSWRDAFGLLQDFKFLEERKALGLSRSKEFTKERMCIELEKAIQDVWPDLFGSNKTTPASAEGKTTSVNS